MGARWAIVSVNSSNPADRASWPGAGVAGARTRPGPALQVDGVCKAFNGKTVLHPLTLSVGPGEIHVLVGQNGSGKSTLIKILSGYHAPEPGGQALIGGQQLQFGSSTSSFRLGCRFVHQDLGLVGSASVLDNLSFSGGYPTRFGTIRDRSAAARARQSLGLVGLDIDPSRLVATLGPAQQTGVAVARAMAGGTEVRLLVLDEPTATLPTEEVDHLLSILRRAALQGLGILYVTHHLDEVFQFADRVSVLRDGRLVSSTPIGEIDRPTLVRRLVGGEVEAVRRDNGAAAERAPAGPRLIVRDLAGGPLRGVTFSIRRSEIVGVYGLTGSGSESLLPTIFGALPLESGSITLDGVTLATGRPDLSIKRGIGYLPPDRKVSGGFMSLTATENLTVADLSPYWRSGWMRGKQELAGAREWFQRLQVRPADGATAPLDSFSGGNQQKILLGKWLRVQPKVLLLDEPTQGVDVGAKAELHRLILTAAADGTSVVINSTDEQELASLCSRVLIIRNGVIGDVLNDDEISAKAITTRFHADAKTEVI